MNQAIREECSLNTREGGDDSVGCPFYGIINQRRHSECRNCGRPMNLEQQSEQEEQLSA